MSRIGFLGTGHIAAPMARALARDGHHVTVSERNAQTAAALQAAGLGIAVAPNQQVLDQSDIVMLCLRPAVWADVAGALSWRSDHRIVSVMAGVPMAEIATACAPATEVSVTIPYGYIENGGCPLPVAGDTATVQALFGATNPVLPQRDEDALRYHFAASTLTTVALSLLIASADWLADQTGDQAAAEVYVTNLVSGFLADLPKDAAGQLATERDALATPNTLNQQMFDGLVEARAFGALPDLLTRISNSMTGDT